jgi:hypothetical protein
MYLIAARKEGEQEPREVAKHGGKELKLTHLTWWLVGLIGERERRGQGNRSSKGVEKRGKREAREARERQERGKREAREAKEARDSPIARFRPLEVSSRRGALRLASTQLNSAKCTSPERRTGTPGRSRVRRRVNKRSRSLG